ncbi:MAG: glycine zipper 2TM domain-containing protein [Proteobacteria bacterium]|nr:glycine zipper 2TM domain-containing protein [Pseudomonadota bacterium]
MKTRLFMSFAALAGALLLGGCVTAPAHPAPPPAPPPVVPPPNVNVYAYPVHGQSPEQQDRDRYECSIWATQQSGFSPSGPGVPAQARVVQSPTRPPGTGTAVGAMTGAILGAAISNPWQAGAGALAGALVGGAIGTAADAADAQQTRTVYVTDQRQVALQHSQANNYRRAISACLDARGYSVK